MTRSRCFWSLTFAALLSGCASVEVTPLVPAGATYVEDANPVYVPLAHYGKVYEAVLQTLDDFGFEWLPDDNDTQTTRRYVNLQHESLFGSRDQLEVLAGIEEVSDDAYFEDLGSSLSITSQTHLNSFLDL